MDHDSFPSYPNNNGEKIFAVRLAVLLFYIITYFLLFYLRSKESSIFWSTLLITSMSLWFGLISLIGSSGMQKFYDPKTIFNLGVFYYSIKGISLAWGDIPIFLNNIYFPNIVHDYPYVAAYVLIGILAWNLSYTSFMKYINSKNTTDIGIAIKIDEKINLYPGVALLSVVGLVSFFILVHSVGQGFLVFITHPEARGYLSDPNAGAGISYGFFVLYAIYMMPIASILWLLMFASNKMSPNIFWWLHATFSLFIVLLAGPRTSLIGFVITLFLIYHLRIQRISFLFIGPASLIIFLYASVTRLLRGIMGSMSQPSITSGLNELFRIINMDSLVTQFLGGTNLADIRIFILIQTFYGHSLPLKYGETLLRIFTQLVPRSIWPAKPYDLGVEIGHLYDPLTLSGSPPGLFAEMFMNFHFVGVLFGAALAGTLLSLVYYYGVISKPSNLSFVLYSILAPLIFILPSSTMANFIINMSIYSVGVLIAFAISNFTNHADSNPLKM